MRAEAFPIQKRAAGHLELELQAGKLAEGVIEAEL